MMKLDQIRFEELRRGLTRNQIRKQQYVINKRLSELYPLLSRAWNEPTSPDVNSPEFQEQVKPAQAEAQILNKELEELGTKMLESRDEDEPQQESYTPPGVTGRIPLLVLLHGAGWTGGSQVEIWKPIAEREHIALFAPTSIHYERDWTHPNDYDTLAAKFYQAVNSMPIDHARIYLVGHSRGAAQALRMGLMNENWIAALALHSPSRDQGFQREKFPQSSHKMPIRIWAGSDYELDQNRTWAEVLALHFREHPECANVDLDVMLLDGHRHRDYNTREGLLDDMWAFLKDKSLR
jgi:pimeloyl-ACP methyl ester carboxylesterase